MSDLNIKKLYYAISEVSEITQLKPYILRYWESEFAELRPSKNRAGNRIYRSTDIELISSIKGLLYDEKFTIAGAKRKLRELRAKGPRQIDTPIVVAESKGDEEKVIIIADIRKELNDIKSLLSTHIERGVAQSG